MQYKRLALRMFKYGNPELEGISLTEQALSPALGIKDRTPGERADQLAEAGHIEVAQSHILSLLE